MKGNIKIKTNYGFFKGNIKKIAHKNYKYIELLLGNKYQKYL